MGEQILDYHATQVQVELVEEICQGRQLERVTWELKNKKGKYLTIIKIREMFEKFVYYLARCNKIAYGSPGLSKLRQVMRRDKFRQVMRKVERR